IPLLLIPSLTFAIAVATQLIMLLLSTAVLVGSGISAGALWTHSFQMWVMLLYHLLAIHALWYAPIYAWLILVSAWARRAAFLWAFLPPIAIGVVEKIAFNTTHFAHLIEYRFGGGLEDAAFSGGSMAMDPISMLAPGRFLTNPDLWIGLAVAAALLAAAVRLRRSQGPI